MHKPISARLPEFGDYTTLRVYIKNEGKQLSHASSVEKVRPRIVVSQTLRSQGLRNAIEK